MQAFTWKLNLWFHPSQCKNKYPTANPILMVGILGLTTALFMRRREKP
jgi:hypothetical protein